MVEDARRMLAELAQKERLEGTDYGNETEYGNETDYGNGTVKI